MGAGSRSTGEIPGSRIRRRGAGARPGRGGALFGAGPAPGIPAWGLETSRVCSRKLVYQSEQVAWRQHGRKLKPRCKLPLREFGFYTPRC